MFTAVAILTSCLCIHLVWVPNSETKRPQKNQNWCEGGPAPGGWL